jgi:hypothetical protein
MDRFVLVGEKEEDESEVFINLWHGSNRCYPKAKLQKFYHNNKFVVALFVGHQSV